MNWILPAITVGLGGLMIAMAIIVALTERERRKLTRESKQLETQRDELNRENESLHTANKRIVTEQLELHKQNTKLREDLTEAQDEINRLNMRTIEISTQDMPPALANVAIDKPEPKRQPRKPKAGMQ